mmetsp:Transcript_5110/g.7795  ORF Transcript_5110/g.7795 Transcript_5110/m.7795 type:complete len:464 (-) Transcript_5110:67-1458(-)
MRSTLVPLVSYLFLWGGRSSSSAAAFSHGTASFISTSTSTSMSQQHGILSQRREAHNFCGKRTKGLCQLRMSSPTLKDEITLKSHKHALGPRRGVKAFAGLGIFLFTLLTSNAAIAKTAATTVSTAAAPVILPPMHKILLACLLPTLLGFYKSEYGVSYGYGTAMAASSYLILASISQSAGLPLVVSFTSSSTKPAAILTSLSAMLDSLRTLLPASLPAFHAFALFFYGTRLNLFLLYRELCLPRFRAMRERIEDRAKKQGGRLKRTPFLLSCTFLYFCMVCPVLVTTKVCEGMSMSCAVGLGGGLTSILEQSLRLSVIVALSGFLLGAFGDLNKSIGKMLKGEDTLITGGIFRYFRHPNYTGEVIGWTSSCLAAFLAVALKAMTDSSNGGLHIWKSMAGYLSLSVMGTIGISFVLGAATAGLEFRQHEKYGDSEEYKQWVKKSWVGFKMGKRKKDDSENGQE